jgi:hypothetical protein
VILNDEQIKELKEKLEFKKRKYMRHSWVEESNYMDTIEHLQAQRDKAIELLKKLGERTDICIECFGLTNEYGLPRCFSEESTVSCTECFEQAIDKEIGGGEG